MYAARRILELDTYHRYVLIQVVGMYEPRHRKRLAGNYIPFTASHIRRISSLTHWEPLDVEVVYAGELHVVARVKRRVPEDECTEEQTKTNPIHARNRRGRHVQ